MAEGAPLLRVWGDVAEDDRLTRYVEVGSERSLDDDPLYGFRQLVDIADRALSPGTDDPTTAVQAIDHLHDLLRRIVGCELPNGVHTDDDGRPRLFVHEPSWQEFLDVSVDEVAITSSSQP
ncbi:MAG: DUF2254 family protein [Acidimicrobiales bacterium]